VAEERVVATKLEQIEQYHGELTEKRESLTRTAFMESVTEQRAIERMFENAIQACSDLAQHVATRDFDYQGNSAKGAVRELEQAGILEPETADRLVEALGFRNILAHEYGHVDANEVFDILQTGLDIYDAFSRDIAEWVRQE
jgi:uncharacterized protein YutE (UPF0331/DUF86 family)